MICVYGVTRCYITQYAAQKGIVFAHRTTIGVAISLCCGCMRRSGSLTSKLCIGGQCRLHLYGFFVISIDTVVFVCRNMPVVLSTCTIATLPSQIHYLMEQNFVSFYTHLTKKTKESKAVCDQNSLVELIILYTF